MVIRTAGVPPLSTLNHGRSRAWRCSWWQRHKHHQFAVAVAATGEAEVNLRRLLVILVIDAAMTLKPYGLGDAAVALTTRHPGVVKYAHGASTATATGTPPIAVISCLKFSSYSKRNILHSAFTDWYRAPDSNGWRCLVIWAVGKRFPWHLLWTS
jgi:hypothetical protein